MKIRWGIAHVEIWDGVTEPEFEIPDDAVIVGFHGHDRVLKWCHYYTVVKEDA